MARRITKAETGLIMLALVVGIPVFIAVKFVEAFGIVGPLIIGAMIFAIILIVRAASRRARRARLLARYQDEDVVEKIIQGTIWVGQTEEQLVEALGRPADVDEKVLKTKRKEIWKYAHRGGNRYGLRITVENGCVLGWDERM